MWDKWVSVKHLYTSEIVYAWSIDNTYLKVLTEVKK